jgi:hypothetical protein
MQKGVCRVSNLEADAQEAEASVVRRWIETGSRNSLACMAVDRGKF